MLLMRTRIGRLSPVVALVPLLAGLAPAGAWAGMVYPANAAASVLHGGDRELLSLGFAGSPTALTGADFLRFADGVLHWDGPPAQDFSWNAPVPSDLSPTGDTRPFNPDRADAASALSLESSGAGTLADVFGPFNGYKNMSRLLDGETTAQKYHVDLYFGGGFRLSADQDPTTVEVALLERGANSDVKLQGILPGGGLTAPIFVGRGAMGPQLWKLNSLEIGGEQKVVGAGVSVDSSWLNLIGLRISSHGAGYDGPDLVAVAAIPEPATLLLLACGGVLLRRR
jgi:hypothetical protein